MSDPKPVANPTSDQSKTAKADAPRRTELTPEQHRITQQCGTEPPFTGAYWDTKKDGTYHCVVCGQPLYQSEAKYDSGTGWPSFYTPIEGAVATRIDRSHGMERTEAVCSRCGAHLGHVFPDGPKPTGIRHCINSASLKLEEAK